MDLRKPTGSFFSLLGVILVAVGLIQAPTAPMVNSNVNLYAGAAMLLFGGVMLWLSRKHS